MNVSSSFIRKRPGSRMFWFRIVVPGDLRAHFGKPEISFSLKTADVFHAKEQALQLAQKYQREFERSRRESCTRSLDEAAANKLIGEMLLRFCRIVYQPALDSASPVEYYEQWLRSDSHRDFLVNLLCEFNFKLDSGNEGWIKLCRTFDSAVDAAAQLIQEDCTRPIQEAYARLQKLEAQAANARARYNRRASAGGTVALLAPSTDTLQALPLVRGGNSLGLTSPLVGTSGGGDSPEVLFQSQRGSLLAGDPNQANGLKVSIGPTLHELIDSWANEKGEDLNPKTEADIRKAFEELTAYADVKYASEVSVDTVIGFKMYLLRRGKGAAATSEGKSPSKPVRTNEPETVKKKIGFIKLIFNYAIENRLIRENPAIVKVKIPKNPRKRRVQFEAEDVKRIFSTPLFTEKRLPVVSGAGGEAAYWLPLLEHFTGARPEELGQLYVSDVKYFRTDDKMIPYITINNLDDKGTKTKSSNRDVPLHPELIRRGFLAYVRSQSAQARLFPLLRPDRFGHLTSGFSKWINGEYLRRQIGIADIRKVNYSFRHSFITACRNSGMSTTLEYALTGHELGTVHDRYGEPPSVAALYSALLQIQFDGFPFTGVDDLQS